MPSRRTFLYFLLLFVQNYSLLEASLRGPPPLRQLSLNSRTYHVLPFTTTVKIEINPTVDRQPTIREYGGLARAISQWFSQEAGEIYGEQVSVDKTLCILVGAKWRPFLGEEYAHTITLDCEITLMADADDIAAIPTVGRFLLDTSAHASVLDLVTTYLQISGGSPSVFRYTQRAIFAG